MIIKFYFEDGSSNIRSFSDNDLNKLRLLDKLQEYLIKFYAPEFKGYELFSITKKKSGDYIFNLKDYFMYYQSFIGIKIDKKLVCRVEFFNKGSYEYVLDLLNDEEGYERGIKLAYTLDNDYLKILSLRFLDKN